MNFQKLIARNGQLAPSCEKNLYLLSSGDPSGPLIPVTTLFVDPISSVNEFRDLDFHLTRCIGTAKGE